MSLSPFTLAHVFERIRAPALLIATFGFLAVSPPASAQDVATLQIAPPPTWNGWEDLQQSTCTQAQQQTPGACFVTTSAADCVTTGDNRIDCFARAWGGAVARRQWDGGAWQPWSALGNLQMHYFSNAAPECVVSNQGRIDCIARDSNVVQPHPSAAVYHFPVGGGSWSPINQGVLSSDPECISPQAGRIDCFGRGMDGALWQSTFEGQGWSAWNRRGDQILELTKPSCVTMNSRIICVFVSPANQLREFSITLSGSSPSFRDVTTPGSFSASYGVVATSPKCVVNGGIHCIMPAINGNAYMLAWLSSDGASAWSLRNAGSNSGGVVGISFGNRQTMRYDWDCVVMRVNRVDCVELVVQGMRSRFGGEQLSGVLLRHGVLAPGAGTSSWSDVALSTAPAGYPTFLDCVSWGVDRIDCFATGSPLSATALWHAWLAPPPPLPGFGSNRPPPIVRRP